MESFVFVGEFSVWRVQFLESSVATPRSRPTEPGSRPTAPILAQAGQANRTQEAGPAPPRSFPWPTQSQAHRPREQAHRPPARQAHQLSRASPPAHRAPPFPHRPARQTHPCTCPPPSPRPLLAAPEAPPHAPNQRASPHGRLHSLRTGPHDALGFTPRRPLPTKCHPILTKGPSPLQRGPPLSMRPLPTKGRPPISRRPPHLSKRPLPSRGVPCPRLTPTNGRPFPPHPTPEKCVTGNKNRLPGFLDAGLEMLRNVTSLRCNIRSPCHAQRSTSVFLSIQRWVWRRQKHIHFQESANFR